MKKIILITLIAINFYGLKATAQMFYKTYTRLTDGYAYSVQQTFDGGYILSGATPSGLPANNDAWIIKLDANGDTVWTRIIAGNPVGHEMFSTIRQLPDSGYIASGYGWDTIANHFVPAMVRLNAAGNILWMKWYRTEICPGPCNTIDMATDVIQTPDGGFAVTGRDETFVGTPTRTLFILKTDSAGNIEWAKDYDDMYQSEGARLAVAPDSGLLVIGFCGPSPYNAGSTDMYVIRTKANGDTLWVKSYGGNSGEIGMCISPTGDSCFILTGYTTSFGSGYIDVYLVKINSQGDTLWSKTYGEFNGEYAYTTCQDADGNLLTSGRTSSFNTADYNDFLLKTDSAGNLTWTKMYGASEYDYRNFVSTTNGGGYVLAGRYKPILSQTRSVFVIKTNSNGETACNYSDISLIETNTNTQVRQIPAQISDMTMTAIDMTPIVYSDSILIQDCLIQGYSDVSKDDRIRIYPNPATKYFSISGIQKGTIEIFNAIGKLIYSEKIKSEPIYFNQPSGIYFVRVSDGERVWTQKLVIE
jgi:hypothetical protein